MFLVCLVGVANQGPVHLVLVEGADRKGSPRGGVSSQCQSAQQARQDWVHQWRTSHRRKGLNQGLTLPSRGQGLQNPVQGLQNPVQGLPNPIQGHQSPGREHPSPGRGLPSRDLEPPSQDQEALSRGQDPGLDQGLPAVTDLEAGTFNHFFFKCLN